MRKLLNPKWLLLINTLPVLIMCGIFYGEFTIIKSLLSPESLAAWETGAMALGSLAVLTLVYSVYLIIKKQDVHWLFGILALIFYSAFLYVMLWKWEALAPFSIPRWMISEWFPLYAITFIMPTLAYSIGVLMVATVRSESEARVFPNFIAAILIPLSWYLMARFAEHALNQANEHIIIVFALLGTFLFLFALARGVYIIGVKKASAWAKYRLAWQIPITIILPLLGLLINHGFFTHWFSDLQDFSSDNGGIFANFSHPYYFILALLNGLFICFPNYNHYRYRLILFVLRSATFMYTLYFFIVFLPFLPLSVVAIIAVGIGFLLLAPLLLFIVHVNVLVNDYRYLKERLSTGAIAGIFVACALVLPMLVTVSYLQDKRVLNEALEYVYYPDYNKDYHINKAGVANVLWEITEKHNNGFIYGGETPYLSTFYHWLVFDNMTLSEEKIAKMKSIFEGGGIADYSATVASHPADDVRISDLKTTTRFDEKQQALVSTVDLQLTNNDKSGWNDREFATTITLPPGCFISNYYLYVGDVKEPGILSEKKAAMWIYQKIRDYRRDPGILYYQDGNHVRFRVYPFAKGETRRTGIEFTHKEPLSIELDERKVELGTKDTTHSVPVTTTPDKLVTYIPAAEKTKLKTVERTPYFHFIIDVSRNASDTDKQKYVALVDTILAAKFFSPKNAMVTFCNAYTTTTPLDEHWKEKLKEQKCEGGFYLDRAIKQALINGWERNDTTFPVIAVLSGNYYNAIMTNDLADFNTMYPESDWFYVSDLKGNVKAHSFLKTREATDDLLRPGHHVLAWPDEKHPLAWLRDDGLPSVVLTGHNTAPLNITGKGNWEDGLAMQGKWMNSEFYPKEAEPHWKDLVKNSFQSGIMNPLTSYLVVENEAQKQMLKKKQAEALAGNPALDLTETAQPMSEPGWWLLLAAVCLWFGVRVVRRKWAMHGS